LKTIVFAALELLLVATITTAASSVAAFDACAQPPSPSTSNEELLVKFRPGADPGAIVASHGATILGSIPGIEVYLVVVDTGITPDPVGAFSSDPGIEFAERNQTYRAPELPD
jgi:hypothetical protein